MDKNIARKLIRFYYRIPYSILKLKMGEKRSLSVNMDSVTESIDDMGTYYLSYNTRPKFTDEMKILNLVNRNCYSDVAIVMQGPLLVEDDFTYETLKLYKRQYPGILIIVSTWKGSDEVTVEKIRKLGVEVLLNDPPRYSGPANFNNQLKSTKAGIQCAEERNKYFILKTRTDQRLYRDNVITFLLSLTEKFPSNVDGQNRRLIALSTTNGGMFMPFFISDMLWFGTLEELKKMTSITEDLRSKEEYQALFKDVSFLTKKYFADNDVTPECRFFKHYAKVLGRYDGCTVQNYWEFVKGALIILSVHDIGLYWPKYRTNVHMQSERDGSFKIWQQDGEWFHCNFDFASWHALAMGNIQYKKEYEDYANYVIQRD